MPTFRTRSGLKVTIAEAPETDLENLRAIYLAGGSSRIPLVKQLIEENLGMEPDTLGDPKEVISRGAVRALYLTPPAPQAPPPSRPRQKNAEQARQEKVAPPPPAPPKPAPAPAAASVPHQTKLRTHFAFSIVSILLFWPTAIPAIVYASRAKTKMARGDQTGAKRASKLAFRWCIVSLVIFVAIIAIAVASTHHSSSSSSY